MARVKLKVDGRVKNGGYRPGSGRPKGASNVAQSYREAFAKAIEQIEAGPSNLADWGEANPTAFWTIASRLLPISMEADITSGGEPLRTIEITYVGGSPEISGPGLRQLPEDSESADILSYDDI